MHDDCFCCVPPFLEIIICKLHLQEWFEFNIIRRTHRKIIICHLRFVAENVAHKICIRWVLARVWGRGLIPDNTEMQIEHFFMRSQKLQRRLLIGVASDICSWRHWCTFASCLCGWTRCHQKLCPRPPLERRPPRPAPLPSSFWMAKSQNNILSHGAWEAFWVQLRLVKTNPSPPAQKKIHSLFYS